MLSKKRRISRKEFPYILASGKRYNSPHLLLYVAPFGLQKFSKDSKFSFSVSKKTSPMAVNRNKYRRQGYSIINKHIKFIKSGYFCFFSFKKSSRGITFNELDKEILELLSNASMLL